MSANAWTRPVFNLDAAAWRGIRSRNREPIARGLALRFYLAGSALSALDALQKRIYQRVLDEITTRPPVFLVGYWRSGTTLLHELLALDDCFAAPSTYECFNPHRFLLTVHRAPGENRVVRPAGDMTVSPSSPQEEEFALLCMGAISPYEAFMFPGALERFEMLCDPDLFEHAQQLRWNAAMTWILKATAYVHGADRRLLLKSPANSFRLGRLAALCPGAAFVRLVREPCAVFASNLRLWPSMWKRYALTAPLEQAVLIERILESRRVLEQKLRSAMSALPTGRHATVRYEDLVSDPRGTIELLYDRLALGDPSAMLPKVSAYLAARPRAPAQSAEKWRPMLQARWTEMFDEFSYSRG
ncbi:MAG: sulfotransferase [Candidatus Binataceae bacterium]